MSRRTSSVRYCPSNMGVHPFLECRKAAISSEISTPVRRSGNPLNLCNFPWRNSSAPHIRCMMFCACGERDWSIQKDWLTEHSIVLSFVLLLFFFGIALSPLLSRVKPGGYLSHPINYAHYEITCQIVHPETYLHLAIKVKTPFFHIYIHLASPFFQFFALFK